MRLATPIKIGVPALIILAMVAMMAFMAWGGSSASGLGASSKAFINVNWEHRSPNGELIAGGSVKNALATSATDVIWEKMISGESRNPFHAIIAIKDDNSTDNPNNGIDANRATLTLDGLGDNSSHQNPADGTVSNLDDNSGSGTIFVTFTASATVTVKQIALVNAAPEDTVSSASAHLEKDVLAFVDVPDVTLDDNDTVKYTWTVTFS